MQTEGSRYNLVVQAAGLLGVALLPLWVWTLFFSGDYDSTLALVLVPAIMLVNLVLLRPAARVEPFLRRLLPVALLWKFAATSVYLWVYFRVYGQEADISYYWGHGEQFARDLAANGHWVMLQPFWSTNFIVMLTGLLFRVVTPSLVVGVVVYSMVAFWGQYLFYRAFLVAFPEGNRRLAALLIFLLPSVVFWTSTIGKDAIMLFCLGLVAYAFARFSRASTPASVVLLPLALAGVLAVRPHIAAMMGSALLVAFLLGRNRQGMAGIVSKVVGVPLLLAGCAFMALQAKSFVQMETFSQAAQVLQRVSGGNLTGGSAFGAGDSLVLRVLYAPFLLFRPFPWEVHNLQSAISSAEGLLLLWIFVRHRRELYAAVRHWRDNPFVAFVLLVTLQFAIILSAAVANFGLLSRERVMLLPFAMMLSCTQPAAAMVRQGAPMPPRWQFQPATPAARAPSYRRGRLAPR